MNDASNGPPDGPVNRVLDLALRVLGSDRGFVVVDRGDGPAVVAARSRTTRDRPLASRSALRAALSTRRPRAWTAVGNGSPLIEIASVRRLGLTALAAAPVPVRPPHRSAILLGWSGEVSHAKAVRDDLLQRFGELLAFAPGFDTPSRPVEAGSPRAGHRRNDLVGRSSAFRRALRDADAVATTTLPVLIEGETGSGKEALAHRIHFGGPRASGPFVAINCAAIPESLIEGELFGAVRGAYTGAIRDRPGLVRRADGGSLFLDEIGELPLALQAKLLRVLQEKRVRAVGADDDTPVDVRVLAATHRDLDGETLAGRFRRDLFHRVAVLRVRVPPLRSRIDDLEPLVAALRDRLCSRFDLIPARVEPCALERMRKHPWPGNVRELESVLARAMVARAGRVVRARDLRFDGVPVGESNAARAPLEVEMIRGAIVSSSGSITEAARRIGWTRQKLYRRMRALGVPG